MVILDGISTFPLRFPEDLRAAAAEQAEALGISLDQYVGMYLAARGFRGSPESSLAALKWIGRPETMRDDHR